jgi:hypothetical protein
LVVIGIGEPAPRGNKNDHGAAAQKDRAAAEQLYAQYDALMPVKAAAEQELVAELESEAERV